MADTKIQKSVKIVVGISTNPSVAGRYFAQLLDTTHGTGNQMTVRTHDLAEILDFIASVQRQAEPMNIQVTVEDTTGELNL
jgi:hypothetical protein